MLLSVWLNRKAIHSLDIQERAFAYGDGVFSTLLIKNGQAKLLDLHWQRLIKGCTRLHISCDLLTQWQQDFALFMSCYPNSLAKIIITRGCSGRGYLPDEQSQPHCYFYAYTAHTHPIAYQQGIQSTFLTQCLGLNPLLAGIKHLNRLEQVLLRQELSTLNTPEGVVCDVQGHVIEGVFSNIFMVKNNQLYTPCLQQAGVEGILRQHLIHLAPQLGYSINIQTLTPADFLAADEVFFCNSVYGIWPVNQLQDTLYSAHSVTQRLQATLYETDSL